MPEITKLERPPQRIVSICPSNTEMLYELGVWERVVGVDNDSDFPESVKDLPRLGPDLDVDIDKIAALEPDLVVASLSVPGMEKNIARLEERGLPFVALHSLSLQDIFDDTLRIGRLVHAEARAQELVSELRDRMNAIAERARAAGPAQRLYWEWWPKPLISPGGPSWITDLSRLAGGENLFADADKESLVIESQSVIDRDPDVLLICWCGARRACGLDKITSRPGWDQIKAVREGRVHVIWEGFFGRPGPRLLAGLELLAKAVHPEEFGQPEAPMGFPLPPAGTRATPVTL
ncbi:MAG: cobalamin-binding protein [Chloroflexi bacterium]|nr:cobalamin-binding protein [Chloroflexota bacterium]